MFKWLRPAQVPIIGIDITSSAIKMLELSYQYGQWSVSCFACAIIPDNLLNNSTHAIEQCFQRGSFSSNHVALAMPDTAVISKTASFDSALSDKELEALVFIEARKYIPYPEDEINLDFEIQGPCVNNPQLIDVLIVASRYEHVANKINVVEAAGLEVVIVDTESYAIERAALFLIDKQLDMNSEDVVAVLEINADVIRLYVLQHKELIFSREEQIELLTTNALTELYPWHLDKKINPASASNDNERIMSRVKRMVQFFYSVSSCFIDYLFLAGDWSKQAGALDLLQAQLNIPIHCANPFAHMLRNNELIMREAPALMSLCGLAMRTSATS